MLHLFRMEVRVTLAQCATSNHPRKWWWSGTMARLPTIGVRGPMTCVCSTQHPQVGEILYSINYFFGPRLPPHPRAGWWSSLTIDGTAANYCYTGACDLCMFALCSLVPMDGSPIGGDTTNIWDTCTPHRGVSYVFHYLWTSPFCYVFLLLVDMCTYYIISY